MGTGSLMDGFMVIDILKLICLIAILLIMAFREDKK